VRPFEEIVVAHGPAVLRICRSLVGPVDAEDAWSETFLAALRAYPELDPGVPVEAWLVTIARNKAVDLHRARGRSPVPLAELPESPQSALAPAGRDHELWDRLAGLPPKQLRCVVYHYIGGLRYAEIAETVGGSEAAARRAAADGVNALRKAYTTDETKAGASQ
jgi:RNA polymerase sigma factor (sigma-70 family)